MVACNKEAPVGVRWMTLDGIDAVERPDSKTVGDEQEKKGF